MIGTTRLCKALLFLSVLLASSSSRCGPIVNPPRPPVEIVDGEVVLTFVYDGSTDWEVDGFLCHELHLPLVEDGAVFEMEFHVTDIDEETEEVTVDITCPDGGAKRTVTVKKDGTLVSTGCTTPSGKPIGITLKNIL